MSYVAYHKETTVYLTNHKGVKTDKRYFASIASARAGITREALRGAIIASDFAVASVEDFKQIEKTETVENLMSGKPVVQPVNTPWGCNPASETYWST